MKKKTLPLIGNSGAFSVTGSELQELCNPIYAEIIAQYLDLNTHYDIITSLSCQSDDEVIYEVVVAGPNGEGYLIITVNGVIHILKV